MKYYFHLIKEVGDQRFYEFTSLEEHKRLKRAAYEYVRRNHLHSQGRRFRIRRARIETRVGTLVSCVPKARPPTSRTPLPGEAVEVSELTPVSVGEAHYRGKAWHPLPHVHPGTEEMRAEVAALERAISRYQVKHRVTITSEPGIRDGVFGFELRCLGPGRQEI